MKNTTTTPDNKIPFSRLGGASKMAEKEEGLDKSGQSTRNSNSWTTKEPRETREFYLECKALYDSSRHLVTCLKNVLVEAKEYHQVDENFVSNIHSMAVVVQGVRKVSSFKIGNGVKEMENVRIGMWKARLYVEKLAITRLAYDLVVELLDSSLTECALRLANLYNEILQLNLSADVSQTNVFGNTCPMLLYPHRKLSITRILQIIAGKRAEKCSYNLISGLLYNYFEAVDDGEERVGAVGANGEPPAEPGFGRDQQPPGQESRSEIGQNKKLLVAQNSASSNTSVEIYRALTKHLENEMKESDYTSNTCLENLWKSEEKHARGLLILSARVAPQLLGCHLITTAKTSGNPRPKSSVRNKFTNYYQEVLWGEVGGYLDHILLWWSSDPLGGFPPSVAQNLWDYLLDVRSTDSIPPLLMPSVNSLLDAMCCHLSSTSWDQHFRKTIVSAGTLKRNVYKVYDIEGSVTGQLFAEMLTDLIRLNNSCENAYLNIEELPLVEQIPILHRLDHSVHTVRIWTYSRCQEMAGKWDLDGFYCTCHTDITNCLQTLSALKLTDHETIPPNTSVQVTVCTKMRQKLVSEIRENVDKLKRTATECMSVLAKDCRTECLAILHMCFPNRTYWRQSGPLPDAASDYVEKYLDAVLRPVFVATRKMSPEIQQSSSAMILRILCESWLEYVYLHRIKFSEWGAVQLLTDFGAVPTWLMERVRIRKDLLNCLVSHEVLRRCEGVGRLLLRRRGESITMTAPPGHKTSGEEFSGDYMPAEMYVPNQEQWLELRAPIKPNVCCQL